mmetsp:Transcript_10958/g.15132  ORF Transcript_10958/g.15132 Transcript_10958/m.15132 type:complete len:254 (+) Transcript_10958:1247-2008(+)
MTTQEGVMKLRENYHEYHEFYAEVRLNWRQIPAEKVASMIYDQYVGNSGNSAPCKIIDFGCGRDGLFEKKLNELCSKHNNTNFQVFAVDVEQLEFSEAPNYIKLETVAGDYKDISSDSTLKGHEGTFDIAVFCLSFMMKDSLEVGLLTASKLLDPHGEIHIVLNTSKFTGVQWADPDHKEKIIVPWCEKFQEVTKFKFKKKDVIDNMVYLIFGNLGCNEFTGIENRLSGITINFFMDDATDDATDATDDAMDC